MFLTLPIALGRLPFGVLVGAAFFLCLFVAALASAMSLLELAVAPAMRVTGLSRQLASASLAVLCWMAGLPVALSFSVWNELRPLGAFPGFESIGVYEAVDGLTSNLLLPLGGLLISIFAGWRLDRHAFERELGWTAPSVAALTYLLRWIVPAAIVGFVVAGHLLR
jgi:NSS family neurotransmitter:Na+ symporter